MGFPDNSRAEARATNDRPHLASHRDRGVLSLAIGIMLAATAYGVVGHGNASSPALGLEALLPAFLLAVRLKNLLAVSPSQRMKRARRISVRSLQRRTKSTT